MYIVIPTPKYNPNSCSFTFTINDTPTYFATKEQLLNYIKTSKGGMRVFEAKELNFTVDVKLSEKEDSVG